MPTYEYRCQACGQRLEADQRMSDPPLVLCPNCGKEQLTRIVSGGAGVIYRGEGWYVTDYSKKSSGGKDTASPSVTKSDSTSKGASNDTSKEATSTPSTDAPSTVTKPSAPKVD
ncbi:MAG: zinc ribbon domain-containing protein [Bacteroidota bacterium]|nr:zinc ribbon domain-containing protein [Bacteroidota bacterium]MDP4234482.1 zinc ribbon domain-containing protein [Bacteroidota bacterium]MDP4243869.1 zinc ribbon domain-containing protein [Bacteroidota bacterium]MDP4288811.1 zinc ribbon domain-containing protein [Bacteroidota bacterium]